METTPADFPSPIDQFFTRNAPEFTDPDHWPNYLELGLGPEHIPDLIRLATDPKYLEVASDDPALWAPTHAWRALGQLRAEAAIEPLMGLLHLIDEENADWVNEDIPQVLALIGPPAIPALRAYLTDPAHHTFARIAAAEALRLIGGAHLEVCEACEEALTQVLGVAEQNDESLNGFLIYDLVKLKATGAVPLIERAFAAGRVDEMVLGDWEDVQVELGLKPARETPRRRYLDEWSVPEGAGGVLYDPERPMPEDARRWNEAVRAKKEAAERAKAERNVKKKRKRGRGKSKHGNLP
jgi:hypothetical protein